MNRIFKILFLGFLLNSCFSTPPPNKHYLLAKEALFLAKKFEAQSTFPKAYSKALFLYKKAVFLYKNKKYKSAKKNFEESIRLAEKVELKSRIKKRQEE